MHSHSAPWLLASLALGLCTPLSAADTALAPVQVEASAEPTSPSTQASAVERAQDFGKTGLPFLLQDTPSTQVSAGARNSEKLFIRGIEDNNLLVTLNGARQGGDLLSHHQGRVLIDGSLVKSIEIQPGPSGADAGPGAIGGAVSITTKAAHDLVQPGERTAGSVSSLYQSADETFGAGLTGAAVLEGGLGLLATVRREVSDLRTVGGGDKLEATDGSRSGQTLRIDTNPQAALTARMIVERHTNEGGAFRANLPPQTGTPAQNNDDQLQTREAVNLGLRYQPRGQGLIDIEATVYDQIQELELGQTPLVPDGMLLRAHSIGAVLKNTSRFMTGEVAHAVSFGLDTFNDRTRQTHRPQTLQGSFRVGDYQERASNLGVFLQNRMSWSAFRLSAGLRHDDYRTQYANGVVVEGDRVSPNATLTLEVAPGVEVYGGYGESTRGAKTNNAAFLFRTVPATQFRVGQNGVLEPEVGRQREVGINILQGNPRDEGGQWRAKVAAYNTTFADFQLINGPGIGGIANFIRNEGDVTSKGWDALVGWTAGAWDASVSLSVNDVRDYLGRPFDAIGTTTKLGSGYGNLLKLNLGWQVRPDTQLAYSLEAAHRLKDVPAGRPEKPGYAVHGIAVRYAPKGLAVPKGWAFVAALDNVFDRLYASHLSVRETLLGEEVSLFEPGRSLRLVAEYRF